MFMPRAALMIVALLAQPSPDRTRAMELARAGRTAEALTLFETIAAAAPDDIEARLWIARLHARLGQTARAEREFRDVLQNHPSDVDARIGLSGVLLRRGAWLEALATLREVEPDAGENAHFFAVLARAYAMRETIARRSTTFDAPGPSRPGTPKSNGRMSTPRKST